MTSFETACSLLFPGKFRDVSLHPMYEFITKFSFGKTPLAYPAAGEDVIKKDEDAAAATHNPMARRQLKLTFSDVSSEV